MENITLNGAGFIGTCITDIEVEDDASMEIILCNNGRIIIPPGWFYVKPEEDF